MRQKARLQLLNLPQFDFHPMRMFVAPSLQSSCSLAVHQQRFANCIETVSLETTALCTAKANFLCENLDASIRTTVERPWLQAKQRGNCMFGVPDNCPVYSRQEYAQNNKVMSWSPYSGFFEHDLFCRGLIALLKG